MSENSIKNKENIFLERVKTFAAEDNGYRASLRRSAGKLLNAADGKAVVNFYKAYPDEIYLEDQYFFAACLQCHWIVEDLDKAVPIERAVHYMQDSDKESFRKKLEGLLDLAWEKDGYLATKLFRLVKFCKSKGIVVDCQSLLLDLIKWDWESRIVQKKWIREFYNVSVDKKEEK